MNGSVKTNFPRLPLVKDGKLLSDRRGFTLIELMIVVSIIGILAAIAVPNYQWSIIKAKEAVLKETLYNFRSIIDQYRADQGKYPDDLEDLKKKGYMREIPKDPFTKKNDTWVIVAPPSEPATEQGVPLVPGGAKVGPGNVYDVRSGSDLEGTDGKAYSLW